MIKVQHADGLDIQETAYSTHADTRFCTHSHATRHAPDQKTHHVLVVEDEVDAASILAEFLSFEGFHVTTVNDGQAGLDAYHTHKPDIVVTDLRMPHIDGEQLIRELRQLNARLPIIAMTGHKDAVDLLDVAPDTSPVDVMAKPVSLMALSRKIGELCTT